jgi:hypothetical protein
MANPLETRELAAPVYSGGGTWIRYKVRKRAYLYGLLKELTTVEVWLPDP